MGISWRRVARSISDQVLDDKRRGREQYIEAVKEQLRADLTARDPEWGLRRVEDFAEAAEAGGFKLVETRGMPANNLMLLFART